MTPKERRKRESLLLGCEDVIVKLREQQSIIPEDEREHMLKVIAFYEEVAEMTRQELTRV